MRFALRSTLSAVGSLLLLSDGARSSQQILRDEMVLLECYLVGCVCYVRHHLAFTLIPLVSYDSCLYSASSSAAISLHKRQNSVQKESRR
jgi:hypothetical protein